MSRPQAGNPQCSVGTGPALDSSMSFLSFLGTVSWEEVPGSPKFRAEGLQGHVPAADRGDGPVCDLPTQNFGGLELLALWQCPTTDCEHGQSSLNVSPGRRIP